MFSIRHACTLFALVCAPGALALVVPEGPTRAASPAAEPVLLELFTSQGCSSCPPADRLAARMASDPALVVIARPVTYWDRLGWKDTLARQGNTDLQQAYAAAGLAGRNGVYTPQIVVSGQFGTVGSNESDIRRGVARIGPAAKAAIRINDLGEKGYGIGLGGETSAPAELLLVSVARKVDVGIDRGENGGRMVTYTNVLRDETRIAMWDGGKASHVIIPARLAVAGADRHALVLRVPDGGRVLAARWLD
jgi:hypothetical protein